MRISDWSSDVCSSDLGDVDRPLGRRGGHGQLCLGVGGQGPVRHRARVLEIEQQGRRKPAPLRFRLWHDDAPAGAARRSGAGAAAAEHRKLPARSRLDLLFRLGFRSEEHTSELQSLMRISYAVFCLKIKKTT